MQLVVFKPSIPHSWKLCGCGYGFLLDPKGERPHACCLSIKTKGWIALKFHRRGPASETKMAPSLCEETLPCTVRIQGWRRGQHRRMDHTIWASWWCGEVDRGKFDRGWVQSGQGRERLSRGRVQLSKGQAQCGQRGTKWDRGWAHLK
jgi:hypothetical protein